MEQLRFGVEQHRHRSRSLRLLAGAAAFVLRDVGTDDDRPPASTVEREIAGGRLESVHAAQACVLELGHFHASAQRRTAHGDERVVEHSANDDRSRGVVGARFRSETEKADILGVDVVTHDQVEHRVGGHCVDAV